MNTMTKLSLATAAAALFSTAVVPTVVAGENAGGPVKCMGINACKGQSKCQTAENACAGQNVCKGHGWIKVPSAEECTSQGGEVI